MQDVVGTVRFAMGKMDVEGYELPALRGAAGMLERHNPPVWLLEVGGVSERYGYRTEDLLRFLRRYGYAPARYQSDANSILLDDECWRDSQNVLFVAEQHFPGVANRLKENAGGDPG